MIFISLTRTVILMMLMDLPTWLDLSMPMILNVTIKTIVQPMRMQPMKKKKNQKLLIPLAG